jgi:pSer/pThr/pTyr-binding forkhead associated (FHA) protein
MNVNNTPQLIVQAATEIRSFQLQDHSEWTIGREPNNLIQILDRFASRFHAVVGVFEERHIYFRDLNSRNGSTLDGERITEPVLLKHGDRIMIGNTALVLKHNHITTVHSVLPMRQKQALMIHASAMQGKIWQELLLSQSIDVLWDVPGANLQQIIGLKAAANLLPPLIILDIQAVPEDIYGLSHWCRVQRLSVEILLIDSSRAIIPDLEKAYVKTLGFLDMLPALPIGQLCTIYPNIVQMSLDILKTFKEQDLDSATLLSALQSLDPLLSKVPAMSSDSNPVDEDALSSEDMTSLEASSRKVKKNLVR